MITTIFLHKLRSMTLSDSIFMATWLLAFSIPLTNGKLIIPILLLFSLWIFEGKFVQKGRQLFDSKLFLLLLFFLSFSLLSLLWSDYTSVGIKSINPFNYYLLIIPVVLTSIPKEKAFYLIEAFVYGMSVHIALFFLSNLIGWIPKKPFYSPYTMYAAFTAFSSLFFLNRFIKSQKNKFDYLYLILFILLTLFLFSHDGRSAQIAFLATLMLYLFIIQKHIFRTMIFTGLLIAIISTFILFFAPSKASNYQTAYQEVKNIVQSQKFEGSWGHRAGSWITSFYVIGKNPLVGTGAGDSQDAYQRIIERGEMQALYCVAWMDSPHNQFLGILMKVGIIGTLPFLVLIFLFYRLRIMNQELKHLSIIFMTLSCISMMFDEVLQMKPYNIYFALMLALFIASSTAKTNSPITL